MSTLTNTIKKMLNALACADAGEYLSRSQKTRILRNSTGVHTEDSKSEAPAPLIQADRTASNRRRVGLYIGSELPTEMMDYVVQTCARLKHHLTVLTFQPEGASRALLKPYAETLSAAGIDMQLVNLTGDLVPGLARYLRSHPEIAFLACKDTGYLGRSFLSGTQRQNALPVPVVLLEAQQAGARKQNFEQTTQTKNTSVA